MQQQRSIDYSVDTTVNNSHSHIPRDETVNDSSNNPAYSIFAAGEDTSNNVWNTLNVKHSVSKVNEGNRRGHEGINIPFTLEQTDGIFALLIICFLLFSRIYHSGVDFLKDNIRLFLSFSNNRRVYEDHLPKDNILNYFIIIQAIILSAIGIYDVFMEIDSNVGTEISPLMHILSFIIILTIFYVLKINGYRIIGYILDMKLLAKQCIQSQIAIIQLLGIIYFIPILLLVYSNIWHLEVIVFMIIVFVILQLIFFYKISVFFIQEKFNFLFLITYLCSVEIIPYIFLAIGLTYSYNTDILNLLWH